MNKIKLAVMVGVAAQMGLSAATARAEAWQAQSLKVYAADPLDTARTANGRLRKTRYEESNEMSTAKLLDGTKGLFVQMQSGSLNGVQPTHRQSLACTPIALTQNADKTVGATVTGAAKFITSNTGQDYRNNNHPDIFPIDGGKAMLVTYNYRPQGANNTNRYAIVVDSACNLIPVQNAAGTTQKQVVIMQKNNDDCDMHQSSGSGELFSDAAGTSKLVYWAGCNGNGRDDGWVNAIQVQSVNNGAAYKISKLFDVDVEPQEERSRGTCTIGTDPNTAVCSWTAGNNQPQREGTWVGAIDLSASGPSGENANSRLLWKKRIQSQTIIQGVRTYSVRANSARILDSTGAKTDQLLIQTSALHGNNRDNQKGGAYLAMFLGVATATKTGLTWDIPLTDITNQMLGIDATHLSEAFGLVQDEASGKFLPAMTFLQGDQNGGGGAAGGADLKILAVDAAAKKFIDFGVQKAGGSYDRHLYSNYLGGNPGNQGRNFSGAEMVKNPFATAATDVQFLMLNAMTGKDPADVMKPEIKQSSYLSIMPMFQAKTATPPPPAGMGSTPTTQTNASGGGQNAQPAGDPAPATSDPGTPGTPGSFSSGCSMATNASTSASGLFFLLVGLGLVTLARRRRA